MPRKSKPKSGWSVIDGFYVTPNFTISIKASDGSDSIHHLVMFYSMYMSMEFDGFPDAPPSARREAEWFMEFFESRYPHQAKVIDSICNGLDSDLDCSIPKDSDEGGLTDE